MTNDDLLTRIRHIIIVTADPPKAEDYLRKGEDAATENYDYDRYDEDARNYNEDAASALAAIRALLGMTSTGA